MEIKPFKIKVTPEQSKIVQEVLFANGVKWSGDLAHVIHTDRKYLIVDGRISTIGWCMREMYDSETGLPELTFEQFQELYCQNSKQFVKVEIPAWNPTGNLTIDFLMEHFNKWKAKNEQVISNKSRSINECAKVKLTSQHENYDIENRKLQYLSKKEFRDYLWQKAPKLTSQQEIDERLHGYGYNIPQQELASIPDDRLDKIIERLDIIIELLRRDNMDCDSNNTPVAINFPKD